MTPVWAREESFRLAGHYKSVTVSGPDELELHFILLLEVRYIARVRRAERLERFVEIPDACEGEIRLRGP